MLTIQEYIAKRKQEDKLDEFDIKKQSEIISTVIQYVMDYFNSYLDIAKYSAEQLKVQQAIDKFKGTIMERFPTKVEFIISYYWESKKRLDLYIQNAIKEMEDSDLFYLPEDDIKVAQYVCIKKLKISSISEEFLNNVANCVQEYRAYRGEQPKNSDMKGLDNAIVDWVKKTYLKYHVDLLEYTRAVSWEYFETYVERIYSRSDERHYYINKYDYRYQDNPFDIDAIYERNQHRDFIRGHKGELEMLIMYFWLYEDICDFEYWPEYVNLCLETGRVKLGTHKRKLIPVTVGSIEYPSDINSEVRYIETYDGVLENKPQGPYVLALLNGKKNEGLWKSQDAIARVLKNLKECFKQYGEPVLLEITSPYKEVDLNEEKFIRQYQIFERGLKRYSKMSIALVNGHRLKSKNYMIAEIKDMIGMYNICTDLKLRLKLSIDFSQIKNNRGGKYDMDEIMNSLATMRNFIVAIHINKIDEEGGIRALYAKDPRREYVNQYDYTPVSYFISSLGMVLDDKKIRLFIPTGVEKTEKLEVLIDGFLRGGFHFERGSVEDDK